MRMLSVEFLVVALLGACFLTSEDEVARVTSPSGRLDAVLVETNGGATTAFGYYAYLVPRGKDNRRGILVADLYDAGRSNQAAGANLRWGAPSQLLIEYLTAKQERLTRPSVELGADTVTVSLRSGVLDTTAPSGGMLYNLLKDRH